ncbi:MAG: sialate O-acetylesterase [Phycisphaeraceae bacterium]
MLTTLTRFFTAIALILTTTAAVADEPIQVFILAGQSNMQGHGVVSYDGERDYNSGKGNLIWSMKHSASKDQMKHLRDADGKWVERDDVVIWYKVKDKVRSGKLSLGYTGYGGESHIGPELQFGHVVGDALKQPVLLIKTAWGGKSLHKDFRPPSAAGETGPYYTQMVSEVREALAEIKGKGYEIAGFIWQQGWNDMVDKEATAAYADNLVLLAKDIREEFKSSKLPFVLGELGNSGPAKPGSGMDTFRKQQRAGTAKIDHAVFVETAAFARPAELSPNKGHGHHWFGNAESYFLVGDALGKAAVKMIQGEQSKGKNAEAGDASDLFIGKWTSSYEDKKKWDDPDIFLRTDSRDWPPSRFRMRYVFKKDGSCEYLYLHPTDAHKMVAGTWTQKGDEIHISDKAGKKQRNVSFEIVEIGKDKLKTKRLSR